MFNFQKRSGTTTTTASGLDGAADASAEGHTQPHGGSSEVLTMPVDDVHVQPPQHLTDETQATSHDHNSVGQHDAEGEEDADSYHQHQNHSDANAYDESAYAEYHQQQEPPGNEDPSGYHTSHREEVEQGHQDNTYEYANHNSMEGEGPQDPNSYTGGRGNTGADDEDDDDDVEDEQNAQLFTDYHGSADRVEARSRRLEKQKEYDNIPVPPDDADVRTVLAYYRQLIGHVQLVPPKHWREIRFDLPANVAELRLYPQGREPIQDREPIRPSSVIVINLDGTLPENTTPSEYAAQMVQYVIDLLQYQNATTAITALRFVKKGEELSQMVVTLGRDTRLASRVLTEVQAAGLRAHYGRVIFEHPPNATFQVVDYRRTLHDGKGISAEDVDFLLTPMRQTKTVDINVIEGYEPGVFYAPVKRPEAVYAFLWNYFCSFKFQADLFRRYGVLVTQANCPHEFLKKNIPYAVQKRELQEKIKAELLRRSLEERENAGPDGAGHRAAVMDSSDSDVDDEALAGTGADAPPPAWAINAADEIDIFGGGGGSKPASSTITTTAGGRGGGGSSGDAFAFNDDDTEKAGFGAEGTNNPYSTANRNAGSSAFPASTAAALPFVDEDDVTNLSKLLQTSSSTAKKSAISKTTAVNEAAGAPPPTGPGGYRAHPYNWVDPRQQQQQYPPYGGPDSYYNRDPRRFAGAAPPQGQGNFYPPYSGGGGGGDSYHHNNPMNPYNAVPPPHQQQQQQPYYPPGPAPFQGYPAPPHSGSAAAPFMGAGMNDVSGGMGAMMGLPPPPPPPTTSYPELVDEAEDEEAMPARPAQQQQHQQPQGGGVGRGDAQSSFGGGQHNAAASPFEKEGLLSWSMDQNVVEARGGVGGANTHYPSREGWENSFRQRNAEYSPYASTPAPADEELLAEEPDYVEGNTGNAEQGNNEESGGGGGGADGAGILGDYDPSFDVPFHNPSGQDGIAQPNAGMGAGAYNPYGYAQGWEANGYQGAATSYDGYDYQQQQQQMMMMTGMGGSQYVAPHVQEAAEITADLEERVQAAFPLSWAAASGLDVQPFPLDGEDELDREEEQEAECEKEQASCVFAHISVDAAAADLPPPSAEMDDLFQFVHRNVSLIGRLLNKTTTTTVEHANDVAAYRARVARALLLGVTARSTSPSSFCEAWAAAWVPQRAEMHIDPVLPTEPEAPMAETEKKEENKKEDDTAKEGENVEQTAAVAENAQELSEEASAHGVEEEAAAEVSYQLPALLPYLLRMPAGVDLCMLLATHFPRAFARRLLPYTPALLLDETVVRVVLSTLLRRDARPTAPLVRHVLAHWSPLLIWLKKFIEVKARAPKTAANTAENSDDVAVDAAMVKQLVSLLGNTMDAVLAGVAPEQREACHRISDALRYTDAFVASLQDVSSSSSSDKPHDDTEGDAEAKENDTSVVSTEEKMEKGVSRLWEQDGALYRSLLRLYINADVCDGAALAQRICAPSPASTAACLTREQYFFATTLLNRSQTSPLLSREAAAFCGTLLHLIELQSNTSSTSTDAEHNSGAAAAAGASSAVKVIGKEEARQLLETALKAVQTTEAYTALRDAYLNVEGPITRFPSVLALLSSAEVPPTSMVLGSTYQAWYDTTNQQQKRNAEAVKIPSAFFYQPPSRRNVNATTATANARWARTPQLMGTEKTVQGNNWSSPQSSPPQQQQQQPAWATANASLGNNARRGAQSAAQQWRPDWTEMMRVYPASGTPFPEAALPEGWTCGMSRSVGRYYFSKKAPEEGSDATTAKTTMTTYKHPVDGKEYLVTPQAFLQEPGASSEVPAMRVCERANDLHREEAAQCGLPPPAALTQTDVDVWLADQRHRSVFLDVAAMELLGIRYRTSGGGSAATPHAGGAAGLKRGRDKAQQQQLSPEEQQEQLRKIIPSSYPAVGAPFPALYNTWSVYFNSARGQYGFAGPKHPSNQPPLFVHPVTRKHYFIAPQAFVKQRNVSYDVVARAAQVTRAEVEKWAADQRTRDVAIDAAVIKLIPIHYGDVEKALADNAVAAAASHTNAQEGNHHNSSSSANADKDSDETTARGRERASAAGAAAAPSPAPAPSTSTSSYPAHQRAAAGNASRSDRRRRDSGGRRSKRRRGDSDEDDSYSDRDSYSSDYDDDDHDGRGRRGGNRRRDRANNGNNSGGGGGNSGRRGRSPRRRGGGGRRRR